MAGEDMQEVTIGHHPELTVEEVMSIFQRHFGDKYDIGPRPGTPSVDFSIRYNAWLVVAVRLKQDPDKTSLVIHVGTDEFLASLVLPLTFWYMRFWDRMLDEVRSFIENASEFK